MYSISYDEPARKPEPAITGPHRPEPAPLQPALSPSAAKGAAKGFCLRPGPYGRSCDFFSFSKIIPPGGGGGV